MTFVDQKDPRYSFFPVLLVLFMSLSGCAAVALTKAAATVTKTAVKTTGAAAGLAVKGVKAAVGPKDVEKETAEDAKAGKDG